MRNVDRNRRLSRVFERFSKMLFGLVVLVTAGCGPDSGDGDIINEIMPPTDLVLNLACGNVGVYDPLLLQNPDPSLGDPTCVLGDSENPFRTAVILEFDENNPDAPTKFDLLPPAGPDPCAVPPDPPLPNPIYTQLSEKAEFYFWATALARRPSGENQYYTAQALHKLWTAQVLDGFGDPLIQEQAKRAYRSVLDNFFDDVTFFSTRDFNPNCAEPELFYPVQVRDLTGVALVVAAPPTYIHLYPGLDPNLNAFRALDDMADWGYGFDILGGLVFRF